MMWSITAGAMEFNRRTLVIVTHLTSAFSQSYSLLSQGVASLIILSSAGYSWGREAEKLWAEIWNLTHESWS